MSWLATHRKMLANTDYRTAWKACARVPEMVGVSVADFLVEIGARQAAPHLLGGNEARAVEARHLRWQRSCISASDGKRKARHLGPCAQEGARGRALEAQAACRATATERRGSRGSTHSHGIGSGRHGEDGRKGSTARKAVCGHLRRGNALRRCHRREARHRRESRRRCGQSSKNDACRH